MALSVGNACGVITTVIYEQCSNGRRIDVSRGSNEVDAKSRIRPERRFTGVGGSAFVKVGIGLARLMLIIVLLTGEANHLGTRRTAERTYCSPSKPFCDIEGRHLGYNARFQPLNHKCA